MQIDIPTVAEHAEYLALVNAEIRPDRAESNAWDDFPLILHADNRPWMLVARDPRAGLVAGISCLIREFQTNWGPIAVAGIGSVVTRSDQRSRGLSRIVQDEMLVRLRRNNVPLAVLWTDRPEIYAGRGFHPAGWEFHLGLRRADLPEGPGPGMVIRDLTAQDVPAVEALYLSHRFATLRRPGDSPALYLMKGTRALVAAPPGGPAQAAVFCGKGADFPGYVHEWSGPVEMVLPLLAEARRRQLADQVLVPAGAEALAEQLVGRGADWETRPSGCWNVLLPRLLAELARRQGAGDGLPEIGGGPSAWLGGVGADGQPEPGPLTIAVWGFDSV